MTPVALRERPEVGIVVHEDGNAEVVPQSLREIEIAPRGEDPLQHTIGRAGIHGAGHRHSNSHGPWFFGAASDASFAQLHRQSDGALGIVPNWVVPLLPFQDVASQVGQGHG